LGTQLTGVCTVQVVMDCDLESALTVKHMTDGQFTSYAPPNYESHNGMFGGWTTAVALRAVMQGDEGSATPSAITINFVDKIEPGTEVAVHTRRVGGGRSISHWQAELMTQDQRNTLAVASVALTERRESDGRTDVVMPEAPDPDTLEVIHPAAGIVGQRILFCAITGNPPFGRTDSTSTAWVREISGRSIDPLQLAFLADCRAPRSFFWSDGPRLSATIMLSVYFHATALEFDEIGDDYVLSEAFGIRGTRSTSEEHLRIWSRAGALLATSEQLAWYR
jgi:acyl-CoA thioesterase